MDYKFNYEKGTENIDSDNKYINEITEFIRKNIINIKFKNIYFNMQNDEIIIRNMDNIYTKRKKDIIPLIEYEINRYMPINLQNYIIKYKKIRDFNNKESIQGILFPKKFVYICNEISERLNINKKYLHINFDIVQKLIDRNLLELSNGENEKLIVIESRAEDIILNHIFNNKIIESYVVSKHENNNFINSFKKENICYFGIDDDYIKNMCIKKINTNSKLMSNKNKEKIDVSNNYLCALGMII